MSHWTDDQIRFLQLNYGLLLNREIAKELGKTISVVNNKIRELNPTKKGQKEYAVYHDDEFLISGTLQHCSDFLGVSPETTRYYSSPVYSRRNKTGYRTVDIGMWPINEDEYYREMKELSI